jgi:hypothetical protein
VRLDIPGHAQLPHLLFLGVRDLCAVGPHYSNYPRFALASASRFALRNQIARAEN